jgi:hypothetical protein
MSPEWIATHKVNYSTVERADSCPYENIYEKTTSKKIITAEDFPLLLDNEENYQTIYKYMANLVL